MNDYVYFFRKCMGDEVEDGLQSQILKKIDKNIRSY